MQKQFAHLRNLYLLIECAWCKRRLRWQRKDPSVVGTTSHSICPSCAARLLTQLFTLAMVIPSYG